MGGPDRAPQASAQEAIPVRRWGGSPYSPLGTYAESPVLAQYPTFASFAPLREPMGKGGWVRDTHGNGH